MILAGAKGSQTLSTPEAVASLSLRKPSLHPEQNPHVQSITKVKAAWHSKRNSPPSLSQQTTQSKTGLVSIFLPGRAYQQSFRHTGRAKPPKGAGTGHCSFMTSEIDQKTKGQAGRPQWEDAQVSTNFAFSYRNLPHSLASLSRFQPQQMTNWK